MHRRCLVPAFWRIVVVSLICVAWSGCRRAPHREPAAPSIPGVDIVLAAPIVIDHTRSCREQAARFAERALWKNARATDDVLLGWTAHYSRKHQECDVLTEHRLRLGAGRALTYSELWDAFRATALAVWTSESGQAARGVCRVNLSDRPFVSCLTARFFIDDHMTH